MKDNLYKNSEGYSDPTAYGGIKNIVAEDEAIEKDLNALIKTLKYIIRLSDFELIGRIELKHKSGKVFK